MSEENFETARMWYQEGLEDERKRILNFLDKEFNKGFKEKMQRFILYYSEWEDLKKKIKQGQKEK